jgi:hypothetical protein
MNPIAVIETYVGEVVSHLPRKQRNDVAFELRALLNEELQGRVAGAGREADSDMVVDLLASFGRPSEVADRYRPSGFTIIRPADAPRFAWIALVGVALQWILTLVATFSAPATGPGSDWLSRLGSWWLSWGLGSFWWPGILVTLSLLGAMINARRTEPAAWRPRVKALDRDRVSRPAVVTYIALGVVGASIVLALPSIASWGSGLAGPVLDAFVFDSQFLAIRAPWVLLLWAASLAIGVTVLVHGRWSPLTRKFAVASDFAGLALMVWWIAGGPIFAASSTDDVTKLCLLLVCAFILADIVIALRRLLPRVHAPLV